MESNIAIIILNWNGWEDTIECLESLYQINYPNYNVIILDNASEDESLKKIREYCNGKLKVESEFFKYNHDNKPIQIFEYCIEEIEDSNIIDEFRGISSNKKLILIKNDKNYGFALGNNIGIRYAETSINPDYFLLLNNDTIVDKEFLNEMIYIAEPKNDIGFVGPIVYYYDFNGQKNVINFAGGKLNIWKGRASHIGINELDKGQYDTITEVNYVEGSCIFFKKQILTNIGLMNPDYFMYWEELDWCYRAHKEGYKSIFAPKAKIWHKSLFSNVDSYSYNTSYYLSRNRFMFMKLNATTAQQFSFLLYFFVFYFWLNLFFILKMENKRAFKGFLNGLNDGIIYFFKS